MNSDILTIEMFEKMLWVIEYSKKTEEVIQAKSVLKRHNEAILNELIKIQEDLEILLKEKL